MTWDREGDGYFTALKDGVLTLAFNAPEARNPFRQSMSTDFAAIFTEARTDAQVRCLSIRGEGDHLTSGGDIAGFKRSLDKPRAELQAHFHDRLTIAKTMAEALVAFDKPILVRARGAVAGAGMLIPLAADLVIADSSATFVFAYNRIGLTPDGGVSWLLPRAVGPRQAKRLMLTTAVVQADEALRLGLVDRVVPADQLDAEIEKAAAQFASTAQGAARRTKALIEQALTTPLSEQLIAERDGIVASVGTDDFAEGVNAFLEKRRARFS
ncbi:MAG: enoyl-CoA hydratase/isomerase family protein [Sagittula sp.]|uniref:enoyl-CoA hydratase/isomerase family protein n=1 Tax=Sagittula sp. TaxID=2038081 RepID=UPI0040593DA6